MRDPQNGFSAHGSDFTFWLLGSYDDSNGAIVRVDPERVCGAKDFMIDPAT